MRLTVLSGSDEVLLSQALYRRLGELDTSGLERLDLAEDDRGRLSDLLRSASLFTTHRVGLVDHLEAGGDEVLTLLESCAESSDSVIVALWHGQIRAGAKKRLQAIAEIETVVVPTKGAVLERVLSMAKEQGITVDRAGAGLLAERLDGQWGRVAGIFEQLAAAGLVRPTESMLSTLCGSAGSSPAVWDVTEAASSGRTADALRMARSVEPVVLASWVGKETIGLARVIEEGWDADQAAEGLKLHPFRAKKLVAWARRFDRVQADEMVRRAAKLDVAAKGKDESIMLLALSRWAALAGQR